MLTRRCSLTVFAAKVHAPQGIQKRLLRFCSRRAVSSPRLCFTLAVHAETHGSMQVQELNKSIEDFVAKLSPLELFNSVSLLPSLRMISACT